LAEGATNVASRELGGIKENGAGKRTVDPPDSRVDGCHPACV
jgi:hypothetical protein